MLGRPLHDPKTRRLTLLSTCSPACGQVEVQVLCDSMQAIRSAWSSYSLSGVQSKNTARRC